MTNQEMTLEELRKKADALGIEYPKTLGTAKLAAKIDAVENKEKTENKDKDKKPKKLSPSEASKMRALSLRKVIISNLDQNNTGASTVYACVENQTVSIARVLPLDKEIYVEEALIQAIKDMKSVSHKPKREASGRLGAVSTPTETPMYAVASVD